MQNSFDLSTFLNIKNLDSVSKERLNKNIIEYILIRLLDDLSEEDYLKFKREIDAGNFNSIDQNKIKIYLEDFIKAYQNE